MKAIILRAAGFLLLCTVVCGIIYTGIVTAISQVAFSHQANGSIIEVDGVSYGSELMGQRFIGDGHLWGRVVNLDVSTYKDSDGTQLAYAAPSNLSPSSDEYEALIKERVESIRAAHPEQADAPIPVELVTGSGSGLDPHISPAAAEYQVSRIAKSQGMTADEVQSIIDKCTTGRFLGVFGEENVNVLQVNLILDGIIK